MGVYLDKKEIAWLLEGINEYTDSVFVGDSPTLLELAAAIGAMGGQLEMLTNILQERFKEHE